MSSHSCAPLTFTLWCATSSPSRLCRTTARSQMLRTCCHESRLPPRRAPVRLSKRTPTPTWSGLCWAWPWCWASCLSSSNKWPSNSCPRWHTDAGRCRSPSCRTCTCSWRMAVKKRACRVQKRPLNTSPKRRHVIVSLLLLTRSRLLRGKCLGCASSAEWF